jgi:hypothetical protein
MLQDTHQPGPKPTLRKTWQKPAIRHISAGSAEAGGKTISDGAFAYS